MVKKGFLKKTGCILISASIILGGWTFVGSSTSGAEPITDTVLEEQPENLAVPEDSNTITAELTTEDGAAEAGVEENQDVEEQAAEVTEDTNEEPTVVTKLKALAPAMLLSSLAATSTSSETVIEGSTLVKVSNALTSYTVPANITTIAAGAFSDSNISTLTFENGNNITSIGDQGGWPANGTDIYCPNCPSTATVVQYFLKMDRKINVYFYEGPDPSSEYSITIQFNLLDSKGNTVSGSPYTVTTFYAEDGTTPSFDYPDNYIKNGISYEYKSGPSPAFVAATSDATYTYTYQAQSDTPTVYSITINYELQNTSGQTVKTVKIDTLSVNAGEVPTHSAPGTYSDSGKTYGLQSSPTFSAASGDKVYTYTYKEGAEPVTQYAITVNYALQDATGKAVKTVTAETMSVPSGNVPTHNAPPTYVENGTTYVFVSGPNPAFAAATANTTYTYTYRAGTSPSGAYTITINYVLQDANGKTVSTVTESKFSVRAGEVPSYTRKEYYVYNNTIYYYMTGPDKGFAAATEDATYTYVYKVNTGKKRYSVTVKDVFYNYDRSRVISTSTRTTDNYDEGATFSYGPISANGYEYFEADHPSGTISSDRTIHFRYKEITPGSGSSLTPKNTGSATPYASTAAQTNPAYKIIQGAGQIVAKDAGTVTITCDGAVEKLLYILFDGKILDPANYTIKSGSTILTLKADFVKSLSEGNHAVQFQYNDGYAMTGLKIAPAGTKTTTTVTYKVAADGSISVGHTKDTTPKTADGFDSRYLLCIAIFLLGAGAIMMSKQKKLEAILAGQDEE